ncbi:TPA: AAA family ATPase [Aeromonas veronii]|nr:AAA family ATPase [Aeromonas veronii]
MIRQITIRNFRSIHKQTFSSEEITTFVGKNDAGKSNILRALNLFFNNETDPLKKFNFYEDYNINAKVAQNKAKEISIELVFKLPSSYRKEDQPDTVVWRKVWREHGIHAQGEMQQYCRLRRDTIIHKTNFQPRSKIPSLLSNISFIYIPAIKDQRFFRDLQGRLYDVLAISTEKGFHASAADFETRIQSHIEELLSDIDSQFASKNNIKLPKDLRSIFEVLEFQSNNIPLGRRGDGIKIRHIPMILSFIGKKRQSIGVNSIIRPQIWGFEEPENNVEFSTCFELNKQIIEAAKQHTQIFITTHSPAIYSLCSSLELTGNLKTACYYVSKDENETIVTNSDENSIHGHIGFLDVISPIISKHKLEWQNKIEAQEQLNLSLSNELEKNSHPRVFLEGRTDKSIISRLFKFNSVNEVFIDTPDDDNNNALAAAERAIAFHLVQKHRTTDQQIKGVLLLDDDDAGRNAKAIFNGIVKESNNVKAFLINPSQKTIALKRLGFSISKDIEQLLPDSLWQHALENQWLDKIENESEKYTESKSMELFNKGISSSGYIDTIDENLKIMANYRFSIKGKEKMGRYVEKLSDDEISALGLDMAFKKEINRILDSLKIPQIE